MHRDGTGRHFWLKLLLAFILQSMHSHLYEGKKGEMWGVNLCEKFSNVVGNVNYDVLLYLHLSFSLERLATIHHKKCFPFAKNVISKFSSHSPSLVFLNIIAHTLAFNIYIYIFKYQQQPASVVVLERGRAHIKIIFISTMKLASISH